MNKQEWIEEADRRIELAREEVEEVKKWSSREAFWSTLRHNADYAKETIKFLEEGKRLLENSDAIL